MILQDSLISGWEKLELWDHTHMILFGLFIILCICEVILLKITTSAGLLGRSHHYDPDYDDSGEYEEDIYYEELTSNYDQWSQRQIRHRQQEHEQQLIHQYQTQQQQQQVNNQQHNYFLNNYYSHSTDVFRYVY